MQTTGKVMMVRPAAFGFNAETAKSNSFQKDMGDNALLVQQKALEEFDAFVTTLTRNGIDVFVQNDKPEPVTPDAIFPNNWVGFHPGGKVVLYPMMAKNRRYERRPAIVQDLEKFHGYKTTELIDLSHLETDGKFLEGTGSIVFDHDNETAYCSLSPRSDSRALKLLCKTLGYEGVAFESVDKSGKPIYHTNVMLSIGTNWVVVCLDCVVDGPGKAALLKHLIWTGKEIVKVTYEQMEAFCCNILELHDTTGKPLVVLSKTAYNAFTPDQLDIIGGTGKIVPVDIPTIEQYGGGSARCMIAEIF